MRIAIAGATGRVGRHVADVAKERGHEVVPMSRATGVDVITGAGLAEALTGVDDVAAGRPAPYLIFQAMEATGVRDVRRVLVAGDTTRDLQAGCNAGVAAVVGVLTGGQDAAALGAEQHTHILPSVADLPALVARL